MHTTDLVARMTSVILSIGGLLAFLLNVTELVVIEVSSALSLCVAGAFPQPLSPPLEQAASPSSVCSFDFLLMVPFSDQVLSN
jgi:hypothetical protein